MSMVSKTYFIPAPAMDAYREWKSFLGIPEADGCQVIEDIPERGLHWFSHWGVAQIDGRADFIPAQGGCVLYLNVDGVGVISRLALLAGTTLERELLRYAARFGEPEAGRAALSAQALAE